MNFNSRRGSAPLIKVAASWYVGTAFLGLASNTTFVWRRMECMTNTILVTAR